MMVTRILIVLLAFLASTSAAKAAELCNQTSYIVEVASGWTVTNGVAIEGWERVRPGECANLAQEVDLESEQPIFYYAKTSAAYLGGVREWRGGVPLCVDEADFEVVANTRCAALGLASRDFIMREGDDRERTVLVEPDDFGSRAFTAGMQRLLDSAGYPISVVDGYEGRGTRRALNRFLGDIGLASRPGDAELIDALEARALERNAASGLTICNRSAGDIAAALGQRIDDTWESRGWWRMHAGECARVLANRLETANAYFYAERINTGSRRPLTGGEENFCYAPARFVAEGRTACPERGYAVASFRRVGEPVDGGVRIILEEDDFEGEDLAP